MLCDDIHHLSIKPQVKKYKKPHSQNRSSNLCFNFKLLLEFSLMAIVSHQITHGMIMFTLYSPHFLLNIFFRLYWIITISILSFILV